MRTIPPGKRYGPQSFGAVKVSGLQTSFRTAAGVPHTPMAQLPTAHAGVSKTPR